LKVAVLTAAGSGETCSAVAPELSRIIDEDEALGIKRGLVVKLLLASRHDIRSVRLAGACSVQCRTRMRRMRVAGPADRSQLDIEIVQLKIPF